MTSLQFSALDQIALAALDCERETGCPAELSTAQCGIESAWLQVMSGRNNCFGIKDNPGIPGRELVVTHEWFTDAERDHFLRSGEGRTAELAVSLTVHAPRLLYKVRDWFAAFDSMKDCFSYHAQILQRGCYEAGWMAYQKDHELEKYVKAIAVHYATAPGYAAQVMRIVTSANVQAALRKVRAGSPGELPI